MLYFYYIIVISITVTVDWQCSFSALCPLCTTPPLNCQHKEHETMPLGDMYIESKDFYNVLCDSSITEAL
jgi:hypothetical protein